MSETIKVNVWTEEHDGKWFGVAKMEGAETRYTNQLDNEAQALALNDRFLEEIGSALRAMGESLEVTRAAPADHVRPSARHIVSRSEVPLNVRICKEHHTQMRTECERLGMGHLISTTPLEATRRSMAGEFDPVMRGFAAVIEDMRDGFTAGGFDPTRFLSDGCPICEGQRMCPCGLDTCMFKVAIPAAAKACLAFARKSGLVANTGLN